MNNSEYRTTQLKQMYTSQKEFQFKLKLRNPNNNTESCWLNITEYEFKQIAKILDVKPKEIMEG